MNQFNLSLNLLILVWRRLELLLVRIGLFEEEHLFEWRKDKDFYEGKMEGGVGLALVGAQAALEAAYLYCAQLFT